MNRSRAVLPPAVFTPRHSLRLTDQRHLLTSAQLAKLANARPPDFTDNKPKYPSLGS
jgi:hypothetical protein